MAIADIAANETGASSRAKINSSFTEANKIINNELVEVDGSNAMTGALNMGSQKITSLANGTLSTDAVNKGQLDAAQSGDTLQAVTDRGSTTTTAVSLAGVTASGVVSVDDVTQSTSTVTGSLHTDGGLGVAKDVFVGGDLDVTGTVTADDALMGEWAQNSAYAFFGHKSRNTNDGYALIQENTTAGHVYLNSATGANLHLRKNNTTVVDVLSTGISVTGTVTATGNITGSNLSGSSSGTNTGDQTSIVGISGTVAQFNTALTDGTFATSSDLTGYLLNTTDTFTGTLTVTGSINTSGSIALTGNTDKQISFNSLTAWQYIFKSDSEDFIIEDSVGTDFIKMNYGGGTAKTLDLLTNVTVTAAGVVTATGGTSTEWNTAYDNHITGIGFATGTGVLTLTQQDGGTLTQNLDGRYLTSETYVGTVTSVGTNTGLSGTVTTSGNLSLDLPSLAVGGALLAGDWLIADNGGTQNKQLISSIPLSIFSNDAGFTGDQDLSGYLLNTTDTFTGVLTIDGSLTQNGNISLTGNTDKQIQMSSLTAWSYLLKSDSNNWIIEDSDGTDFFKAYYNTGTTTKTLDLLTNVTITTGGNLTAVGALAGSNFSGSSSGTNTGDNAGVTSVATGTNLNGGTITSTGTINLDTTLTSMVAATFSGLVSAGTVTASSNISVSATSKVYLDGGFDTYFTESSANQARLYVGGVLNWFATTTSFQPQLDIIIEATKKFYLDGGGDTYILESSANVLDFYVGGSEVMSIDSSGIDVTGGVTATGSSSVIGSMGAAWAFNINNTSSSGHGLLITAGGTVGTRYITQWKDALGTERFHMDDTGEAYFQGSVAMGNLDVTGTVTASGGVKVTGFVVPTGSGPEIQYASGSGRFTTYNRSGGVYLPTIVDGLTVSLYNAGSVKLATTSTGIDVTGTVKAAGIKLGGGTDILNAYEKGTWTPTGDGLTLIAFPGTYVRIGNLVWIRAAFTVPVNSNTSTFLFSGFPYQPSVSSAINFGKNNSGTYYMATFDGGNIYARFNTLSGGAVTRANVSGYFFNITAVYYTDVPLP